MGKRKLSDSQIVQLQDMHRAGLSYQKIQDVTGIPRSTVEYNVDTAYSKHKKEYDRVKRQTQGVKVRQQENSYNAAHRKERAQYAVEYREKHPVECAAWGGIRRALIAGVAVGLSLAQKQEIKEIYRRAREDEKVRCYLCDKLIPPGHRHVDHIMPLSKGGKHIPSNLAVACDKCNEHKHSKLPYEVGVLL